MKKILFISLLLIPFFASAQNERKFYGGQKYPEDTLKAYRFKITSIGSGAAADSVLVRSANGDVKMRNASAFGTTYTFSTGLTLTSTTVTNNLSTGVSGGQTLIGSTSTNSGITYKATTGVGTTGADHIFTGGNNGATTFLSLFNGGSIRANQYGAGSFTSGTPTYGLSTTSNGTLIETASTGFVQFYTPTITNGTNVAASTAYSTQYQVIGDRCYVWGEIDIDATLALTLSHLTFDIPVSTASSNSYNMAGTGAYRDNTIVQISINTGAVNFDFTPQTATNNKYSFHFSYLITPP